MAKQKYPLMTGFPSNDAPEQFYLLICDTRVFIDIPLHPSIENIYEATVTESENNVYVNGYLAIENISNKINELKG